MEPVKEANFSYDQMLIVERYESVIAYLYPIAQNIPRKHAVIRDIFIDRLFTQVDLFIEAGKSNQISRLYAADAGLAKLRFWMRFLTKQPVRAMTAHQCETAQVLLAEVGKVMGKWIIKQKRKGQAG